MNMSLKVSQIWFAAGLWVILDLLTGRHNSPSVLFFTVALTGAALWIDASHRAKAD